MRTNQKSLSAVNTYNPHEKQNGTTTRTTTRTTTTTPTISNKKLSFGLYSFLCSHRSRNVLKINAQRTKLADYKNINCIAKALATHNIEIPIERNRFPSPAATSTDRSSTRRKFELKQKPSTCSARLQVNKKECESFWIRKSKRHCTIWYACKGCVCVCACVCRKHCKLY